MSANSAVTVLRSPSSVSEMSSATTRTVATGFAATDLPLVTPGSAAAHWPQKSNPGGFSKEQLGRSGRARFCTYGRTSCQPDFQIRTSGSASAAPNFPKPIREYRPNTDQRKQMSEHSNGKRQEHTSREPTNRGARGLSGSHVSVSECGSPAIWGIAPISGSVPWSSASTYWPR
jgi:hypothetical protein